ncbi:MAG TPA: MFS transporter [Acidimicrobiales bacterium]|nr:MFS transporter [Acidimicrobiales bacterium]
MEIGTESAAGRRGALGVTYEHPRAFWLGALLTVAGTVLMLPKYIGARQDHYRLAGSAVSTDMVAGMVLMVVGMVMVTYGVFPKASRFAQGNVSRIRVTALDDAPITGAHIGLILVMAIAVTIDVMKPTTLAFVAPGAAKEYGLRSALNPHAAGWPIGLYPLCGITGTVLGSFIWGWLGDRIGRRASILIAAVTFIATSTCGGMTAYWMHLGTCFFMGFGVGGMLPIIFSLVSETMPRRHRGWIIVLIGGDVAGAYIIMSWLSSTIAAPDRFGWRMLWLVGIPISVVLVGINRWMPESPRFLLQQGRDAEAMAVMQRYGAVVVNVDTSELDVEEHVHGKYLQLFGRPFTGLTVVIVMLALGIGMVQYGFQQWIPSNLQKLGFDEVNASKILRDSALIGFPLNFPIAFLYGFWSSKKTIIIMASLSAAALLGFVVAGNGVAHNSLLLHVLLIVPIWGISSLTAVTAAYAAEVYPTRIRARGTGLAAASTKFGGVMILFAVVAAIAAPSISMTAFLGAAPLIAGIVLLMAFGVETRKKNLEQITAEELGEELPLAAAAAGGLHVPIEPLSRRARAPKP